MTQTNWHAPDNGDLFAPSALCGTVATDEPGGILRMHAGGAEVTCTTCRDLLLTGGVA